MGRRTEMSGAESDFVRRVKETVAGIPEGRVMSYAEVARESGSPGAARAVGSIMKANSDPTVPCHRVIRSDGTTGEFNRGAEMKVCLLEGEGVRIADGKVSVRG